MKHSTELIVILVEPGQFSDGEDREESRAGLLSISVSVQHFCWLLYVFSTM